MAAARNNPDVTFHINGQRYIGRQHVENLEGDTYYSFTFNSQRGQSSALVATIVSTAISDLLVVNQTGNYCGFSVNEYGYLNIVLPFIERPVNVERENKEAASRVQVTAIAANKYFIGRSFKLSDSESPAQQHMDYGSLNNNERAGENENSGCCVSLRNFFRRCC